MTLPLSFWFILFTTSILYLSGCYDKLSWQKQPIKGFILTYGFRVQSFVTGEAWRQELVTLYSQSGSRGDECQCLLPFSLLFY